MKHTLLMASLLSCLLLAGTASPAKAAVSISVGGPVGGGYASVRFDSAGFPIWGFTAAGRPIYGYTPDGVPILIPSGIYAGCYVPSWGPAAYYTGPYWWPAGVCRISCYVPPPHYREPFRPSPQPPIAPHGPSFGGHGGPMPSHGAPGGHGGPGGPGGPGRR